MKRIRVFAPLRGSTLRRRWTLTAASSARPHSRRGTGFTGGRADSAPRSAVVELGEVSRRSRRASLVEELCAPAVSDSAPTSAEPADPGRRRDRATSAERSSSRRTPSGGIAAPDVGRRSIGAGAEVEALRRSVSPSSSSETAPCAECASVRSISISRGLTPRAPWSIMLSPSSSEGPTTRRTSKPHTPDATRGKPSASACWRVAFGLVGRRTNREDRKSAQRRPGRNLSERARAERRARGSRDEEERESRPRPSSSRSSRSSSDAAPAPRPPVPVICPKGKRGYPEHVARAKLAEYAGSGRPNVPVRVYPCRECGSWHLTSREARRPETSRPAPPASSSGSSAPRPTIPPPGPARTREAG